MNELNEIEKLYAKEKGYPIPKTAKEGQTQITMNIKALSLEDMSVLDIKEDAPMDEVAKNAITMFSLSLGITKEAAAKISFEYMSDIMDAIMEENNFNDQDASKVSKIKAFINKRQTQGVPSGEPDNSPKE